MYNYVYNESICILIYATDLQTHRQTQYDPTFILVIVQPFAS